MNTEIVARVAWNRLDQPGRENAEQIRVNNGWRLRGRAEFTSEGRSCKIDYEINCDSGWLTESATISGNAGSEKIDLELLRNAAGEWSVNGSKVWEVTGCDDIDLEFSPSTNTLVIRRANLQPGQSISVRAAWLRFPSLALEPFEQTYTRISESTYRFESGDGKFTRELTVDSSGFVLDYPGLWRAAPNLGTL